MLATKKSGSLQVAGATLVLLLVTYPLITWIQNRLEESGSGQGSPLYDGLGIFWFCIPLLTILGVVVGVKHIRQHGSSGLALVGVLVNTIWMLFLVLAAFFMFVIGASA